jgi:hypothetical protein
LGVIALFPHKIARLSQAAGEVAKRSNEPATNEELPERLTSLRKPEGQRHVRCCVEGT